MVQDGKKFILSRNEEQRLRNMANMSDEDDYDSSGEKESDGDNCEDDDDQPTSFEFGRSVDPVESDTICAFEATWPVTPY